MPRVNARVLIGVVVACGLVGGSITAAQQPQADKALKLAGLNVTGSRLYDTADALRLTALSVGQDLSPAALASVAGRLGDIGLFADVRYTYATTATTITVSLDLRDAPLTVPVVFDNFVWFSDAELQAAVSQRLPHFANVAPAEGNFSGFLSSILEEILSQKKVPARVEARPFLDLVTHRQSLIFGVVGAAAPRVCGVALPGTSGVTASDLLAAGEPLVGSIYSKTFVANMSQGSWTQLYRRRGYWKAAIGLPQASLNAPDGCSGVSISVPVAEGVAYSWAGVRWHGQRAATDTELDKALGMKNGQVAAIDRIDSGLIAVERLYHSRGYLLERSSYQPVLDDGTRQAVFDVTVNEDVQFHMGTVAFDGVPAALATDLAKKWRLKAGEVFDESALDRFRTDVVAPLVARGEVPKAYGPSFQALRESSVVNIRFEPGTP
jgi:outer membrane protein assembly factor BamA